jgi:uncharacterized protein (DUF4213/DUF364 family)
VEYSQGRFSEVIVQDVRVGLRYSAVLLQDGGCGVAFTYAREGNCFSFPWQRPLIGQTSTTPLNMLRSPEPVEAAVGLATLNALHNRPGMNPLEGDVLDQLCLSSEDSVAMVGLFEPLVPVLRQRVRQLFIFELRGGPGLWPTERIPDLLPGCQVALITSTALVNRSLEGILEKAQGCREVVLLGPSTPLIPDFFQPYGITLLSGILVTKPTEVLQAISEAGGTPHFMPFARKMNLRVTSSGGRK